MQGLMYQQDSDNSSKSPADDLDSVLTSEAFYLNCFKILPCSKRYAHEWTTCPFAHPGEKAKRRDPRCFKYDCEMCPAVVKGEVCQLGQSCPHSHHVFESWLHPQKFRTMLCKDRDSCHREVCFFAHGAEQLRAPSREVPNIPCCFAGPSRLGRSGSGLPARSPQQQPLAAGLQSLQLGGLSAMCNPQSSTATGFGSSPLTGNGIPAGGTSWLQAQYPDSIVKTVIGGMRGSPHVAQDQAYQAAAAAAAARAAAANAAAANAAGTWPMGYSPPGGDVLSRPSACDRTASDSLLQMPSMLPAAAAAAAGAEWQGSPQQQQPPLLTLARAMSGQQTGQIGTVGSQQEVDQQGLYSVLTTLSEEAKASKHEAMQNNSAADMAQEQLRLLMSAPSGLPEGSELSGMTVEHAIAAGSSGMMVPLNAASGVLGAAGNGSFSGMVVHELGSSGLDAVGLQPLAIQQSVGYQQQAADMTRQRSAGRWPQVSVHYLAGEASAATCLGLSPQPHPQQQQQQQQNLMSSGSNAAMVMMSNSCCGPSASAGSSKSSSNATLDWLQLSSMEDHSGNSVVLPRMAGSSSAGALALVAGERSPLSDLLQQGRPSGTSLSGPCGVYNALARTTQVTNMQRTGSTVSMPLPTNTSWLRFPSQEMSAAAVAGPGAEGLKSSSATALPVPPSDYLLQLHMAQHRTFAENGLVSLQVPVASVNATNLQQQQQHALAAALAGQVGGELLQ